MDNVISKKKGVCGGDACIEGHRIRVADVAYLRSRMGYTTGHIIRSYPGLHKKQIQAAMRYYRDHREEIERVWEADERSDANAQASYRAPEASSGVDFVQASSKEDRSLGEKA